MKTQLNFFFFLLISSLCFAQVPKKTEMVNLKSDTIYYEVYGEGEPLVLMHGYGLSSKYWLPYVNHYQEHFEVYIIDLTGHGKSSKFNENWSMGDVVSTMNAFFKYLNLSKIRGIGHSYGGDILYNLSVLSPELLKSFVTVGSLGSWDANNFPDWISYFSRENMENLQWMKDYQIDEDHLHTLLDYFKNYAVQISDEELSFIQSKVLIVLGDDDDSLSFDEIKRTRTNIKNSDLWILPDSPHSAHEQNKEDFLKKTTSFLQAN